MDDKKPTAEENLGLVHMCANRFRNRGIEYEELYSAGCVGLLKAVKGFDEKRGVKFSTYAVPVILGEIKRLFRDGGSVRVSRGLKELSIRLQALSESFRQQNGREPTVRELAELSGETESAVAEGLCVIQPTISLTSSDDDEGQTDIPTESPDESVLDLLALRQIMSRLDTESKTLIELRYFRNLTQSATAKIMGTSQVQISRKEKKLLEKMRKELLE